MFAIYLFVWLNSNVPKFLQVNSMKKGGEEYCSEIKDLKYDKCNERILFGS